LQQESFSLTAAYASREEYLGVSLPREDMDMRRITIR
jgi:hypothetical protein